MPRWFRISFLLLFISIQAGAIEAIVSYCTFYEKKPYIEVYWQIAPQSLRFIKTEDGLLISRMKTDIIIRNDTGIIGGDHYYSQTPGFQSVQQAAGQTMLYMRRYNITDGKITIELNVRGDADSNNRYSFKDSLLVEPNINKPFYSDIQLLDTFYKSNQASIFLKNGEQHIPLCANFYDERRNMIHYYGELYNANRSEIHTLLHKVYISQKPMESPYQRYTTVDSVSKKEMQAFSGSFNIATLPSGNYYLNFSLEDKDGLLVASKSQFFQRSNVTAAALAKNDTTNSDTGFVNINTLNLNKTFIGKYTLLQAKAILKMIIPTSTPVEMQAIRSFLKKPDELYMRYFIYNHFSTINPKDPERAWKEYSNDIREVNKLFGSEVTPGYETDRGFVYLKYGKPTERVQVENEVGALPYEVWQYNALTAKVAGSNQANAVFLFYRPSEYLSDMKLLHSTVPGEVRNSQWRTILYTNGGGSNDANSRAEQYIGNR
ncbi:MAG: GWxTD domain-containing protein [Bacteroidetes bacterium]|nr:GWxTD domain-containing protein [Bacteroidota bacterium]